MKARLKQHIKKYTPYWTIAAVSAVYVFLNWNRYFTLYGWADMDDAMQYDLSKSLSEGNWLGSYSRATLIKGVVFPIWTASLHALHIPLWLGGVILTILACLAVVYALRRIIPSGWLLAGIYALLLFNPVVTDRAYRDYALPAITLLVCAWAIGTFVTIIKAKESRVISIRDAVLFTLLGIVALPAWYYIREDGYWIMPLVGGLFIIAVIAYLVSIRWKIATHIPALLGITAVLALPIFATTTIGNVIANQNEKYYGRHVVNDYFSNDFKDAYAALTRVDTRGEQHLTVPVSKDMREQLYKAVPAFRELQSCLDAKNHQGFCEGFKQNGINAKTINDYQGGWFPFALRQAVWTKGYYASASKAQNYYLTLTQQINNACDTGALSCHKAHIVSLLPMPNPTIINALFTSSASSIPSMLAYLQSLSKDDYVVDYAQPAIIESQALDQMSVYYGVRYKKPAIYSTVATIKNYVNDFIWVIYRIITPFLMYGSVLVTMLASYLYLKGVRLVNWKIITIAWLLIATIALRLAMLAYVYTVDFPTTSNVYFAPVYVLVFLLGGIGIAVAVLLIKHSELPNSKNTIKK